jgi:phosphoribosylamine---glycine ligase
MKVLLIGGGGREHALAYKMKQSKLLTELKVFPGNGGFLEHELVPAGSVELKDKKSVQKFVKDNHFDFVVIGPEDPLVDGIIDWLNEIGVKCFGPSAYCSQLEGSKFFAKTIMQEANVPTASYTKFTDGSLAKEYVQTKGVPIVIKADGLAAGKGVTVCHLLEEAYTALDDIFIHNKFGNNNRSVVIEDFMDGEEASVFAMCDGDTYLLFPAAQDHKRAFDGDKGPNTGGMGAYTPAPVVTESLYEEVKQTIFTPLLQKLKEKGYPYKGLLYAGLMIDKHGKAKVVEFNCRFGDPETQALMLLLESDLLELMLACANGNLHEKNISFKTGFANVVVLAAEGYPEKYKKDIILHLPKADNQDTVVFHAGTIRKGDKLLSSGGRVLGVASYHSSIQTSLDSSYAYIQGLRIEGLFYRKDIGFRALNK